MTAAPMLLGFLCHWFSYSASDAAPAARLVVVPNLRTMRVMCTGRVDPELIVKAFRQGADGVLICGCHPGDCHYLSGNHKALGRFLLLKRTLTALGLEPERLRLEWVGATQSERYVEVAAEMTETLRRLGPLHWPELADRTGDPLRDDDTEAADG
ncbi:MAG: hydrogenase iron-sulfur subunit [bacterium]